MRAFLGLVEGPMFPGIVLYLSGFYTRKELSLRYVLSHLMVFLFIQVLLCVDPYSDHLESRYFSRQLRYVVKISSRIIFGLKYHLLALGRFLWFACCRNREHGWCWWKTRMGLDLHSRTFLIIFFYNYSATIQHFHRKDCFRLSWVSLVTSLFPQHHAIPSF